MPSWAIHLKIAKELSKNMKEEDKQSFLLGNILPDVNVGYLINPISKQIPYTVTHHGKMKTLKKDSTELPDYEEFMQEYKGIIKNPIMLGYLSHLMTDYYWNHHTFVQKGVYEKGKLIGIHGDKKYILGDSETIRKTKVSDFNIYSRHLYEEGIVDIPNFETQLTSLVKPIKEIHIEEQDLQGVNQYFKGISEKIKEENQEFQVYSLKEMEESSKENIAFIQKTFENLE